MISLPRHAASGRAALDDLAARILSSAHSSTFDFRAFACPDDPDAHLFDDWVRRYRRKWAVARVLEPDSILEIGTGYGYTAAAFLAARPRASYLGIDALVDDDALTWARRTLERFDVTLGSAPVPGETYDLVHVGGPDDGDTLFHALEQGLDHGRYLLVADYHARARFLAANEFAYQHRDEVGSCWILPGHGGEFLIGVAEEVAAPPEGTKAGTSTSGALRDLYDEHYFLEDCAGHEGYKRTNGGRLRDPRLAAVASIGGLRKPCRVLDLGCGRGELTFHFARHGARVTALDYSPDAVSLAEQCFLDAPHLRSRVELIVADVCSVPLHGPFDLAVASDLVEHLSPGELDVLYRRVAGQLSSGGVLVVHTYPNRWFYEREYPRRRAQAVALGAYLPPNPRTRYERLMHINEQSPEDLRRQLTRHFPHVVVWAGEPADLGRTLRLGDNSDELEAAPGLFALASQSPVDADSLSQAMAMTPLSSEDVADVGLAVSSSPARVGPGRTFEVGVELHNRGARALRSNGPNPFHLSYRWLDRNGDPVVLDGRRSLVFPWLPGGGSDEYDIAVTSPDEAGRYTLRVTAVQEFVGWFDEPGSGLYQDVAVSVGTTSRGAS